MRKKTVFIAAGVLLAAGTVAAISATGPRGHRGGMGGDMGNMEQAGEGGPMRRRGWFGPKSITADEYDTRTRENFARLDKNGDGVIDAAEVEAAMAQRATQRGGWFRGKDAANAGPGADFLRRFGDKDGKVTKEAFLAEAKRRFGLMDLNNDGRITDDDLPPMMRGKGLLKANGPAIPGPMARMLRGLREADVKGDGIITLDAYIAQQTRRFDDLDRNKDGIVNQADFDAMRKEMSDYRVKRFLHAYGADAAGKVTKEQFYKVAKERFARLDPKGEGKITIGGGGERGGREGGRGGRGEQRGGPGMGPADGPPAPRN